MKLTAIPKSLAIKGLISILSSLVLFHLLIICDVIPFSIVWGGRLESHEQMVRFETVSFLVNAFMLTVILLRVKVLKWDVPSEFIQVLLWVMVGIFVLNTFGNILSASMFEKIVFTPITILLALFCARLAMEK